MTTAPPAGLTFHHVGVACVDVCAEAARFATLGYVIEGEAFEDPLQGIRGLFVAGQSPRLELLEPLAASRPGVLSAWLARDVKFYHLAYRVLHLQPAISRLRALGAKVVVPATPAVAFGGREIAFLMLPNRSLIELIASQ